jgi:hypothetical protein
MSDHKNMSDHYEVRHSVGSAVYLYTVGEVEDWVAGHSNAISVIAVGDNGAVCWIVEDGKVVWSNPRYV